MDDNPVTENVRPETVARLLHHTVRLLTALAPFQAAVRALDVGSHTPGARRRLLSMWRPCQARLDLLLDDPAAPADQALRLNLLRQELEDNLLEEVYNIAALTDLADAFEQAGMAVLLEIDRLLTAAV